MVAAKTGDIIWNQLETNRYEGSKDVDENEKLLFDEAEQIYNNIVNVIANLYQFLGPSTMIRQDDKDVVVARLSVG